MKIKTTIHRDWRSKDRKDKMKIEIEGKVKKQLNNIDYILEKGAVITNEIQVRIK